MEADPSLGGRMVAEPGTRKEPLLFVLGMRVSPPDSFSQATKHFHLMVLT